MQASLAAADQARRLDPRVRTSAGHTCFMLGDYTRVLEYETEGIPYMRNLALFMLGRTEEALESLGNLNRTIPNRLVMFAAALEQLMHGDLDASRQTIARLSNIRDPEGRFYLARQLAYIGDRDAALRLLEKVVEDGFFCLPAFSRDPWLDGLRGTSEFSGILRRAETRHRQAVISFLSAEGDRVLGVAHPV
jgi:tetratricopeptide (TPR) repeat protein